jgi:hypothetical protein
MKKLTIITICLFLLLAAGCQAAPAAEEPAAPALANLAVTGLVATPQDLTWEALEAMGAVDAIVTHPRDGDVTVHGVLLSTILAAAQPAADATMVAFIASDGFENEIDLATVLACADCYLVFTDADGLMSAMPGMEGRAWVKNLVTIELR